MNRQYGIALSQLMLWGVILALIAIGAMKVIPSIVEYQSILRAVRTISANATESTTVGQVKVSFSKQMEIDHIKVITADDLDIYKEDGQIIVAFAYDKIIPIVKPVNLLIKYEGSSVANAK